MCAEMLEARAPRGCRTSRASPSRPSRSSTFPPDCKPVDVPLDPALAIGKRFGTLAERAAGK